MMENGKIVIKVESQKQINQFRKNQIFANGIWYNLLNSDKKSQIRVGSIIELEKNLNINGFYDLLEIKQDYELIVKNNEKKLLSYEEQKMKEYGLDGVLDKWGKGNNYKLTPQIDENYTGLDYIPRNISHGTSYIATFVNRLNGLDDNIKGRSKGGIRLIIDNYKDGESEILYNCIRPGRAHGKIKYFGEDLKFGDLVSFYKSGEKKLVGNIKLLS